MENMREYWAREAEMMRDTSAVLGVHAKNDIKSSSSFFGNVSAELKKKFETCIINRTQLAEVQKIGQAILAHKKRYEDISSLTYLGEVKKTADNNAQYIFKSTDITRDGILAAIQEELDRQKKLLSTQVSEIELAKTLIELSQQLTTKATEIQNGKKKEFPRGNPIPWYIIGVIHHMECGGDFKKHLHNGDSLSDYTWQVPAGRPKLNHKPPFSFEESAVDALLYDRFHLKKSWNIGDTLANLEEYNGLAYRANKYENPYLWSFSNHYTKGKFIRDGVFDANAVSNQAGVGVILRYMYDQKTIEITF